VELGIRLPFLKKKKEYPLDPEGKRAELEYNFYNTFTPDDVKIKAPHLYNALEAHFYGEFEFMRLYTPLPEEGILGKIVNYASFALLIVVLIVAWN